MSLDTQRLAFYDKIKTLKKKAIRMEQEERFSSERYLCWVIRLWNREENEEKKNK